jgi:predicted metal-dependent hydrolase
MTKKKNEVLIIREGNHLIPLTISYNSRKNVRFRFHSKGGGISMPPFLKDKDRSNFIEKGVLWAKEYIKQNPHWSNVFKQDKYSVDNLIITSQKTYSIARLEYQGKIKAKVDDNKLLLSIPNQPIDQFKNLQEIRLNIHKCISKDQLKHLEYMVDTVNDQTLQVDINKIRLKYNQSNWGSCSSNRNLSFSSRLLFAPEWVIESVIKHELAHFIEMNHSKAFWKIVKAIDPHYMNSEQWLRTNSWKCDF